MISQEQASKVRDIVAGMDEEKKKVFLEKYNSLEDSKKEIVVGRLLDAAPSVQKPPVDSAKPQQVDFKSTHDRAVKDVASRGNLFESIKNDLVSQNPLRKGVGVLRSAAVPTTLLESGLANPALAMQGGDFNPGRLLSESAKGFTGQKVGEYGDVYRGAGVPGPVAAAGGLVLGIGSPIKALKSLNETFGSISKMSDKGLMRAGNNLSKATDMAERFAGEKLDKAFAQVDSVVVDPNKFINEMSKLPKPLIKKIEENLGPIEDLSTNLTVGTLRKVKQTIGKYRPSIFGRSERGLAETIEGEDINRVYSATKTLLSDSIKTAKGEKAANNLMDLESAFSEVARATDYLKRTVKDPILRLNTRAGKVAGELGEASNLSGRTALNIVKKSGPEARKAINEAVRALEHFNRVRSFSQTASRAVSALTYGGAIGALGGMVAAKTQKKLSQGD